MNKQPDYNRIFLNYVISFLGMAAIFVLTILIKLYFFTSVNSSIFGVIGAIIILGSSVGYYIQSNPNPDGEYMTPERINKWILSISYIIGSFFIFMYF